MSCEERVKIILLIFCLLFHDQTADAQTTNSPSFTFLDYAPTIPASVTKIFTTNITLIPLSDNQSAVLENAVFLNATATFYFSAFPGFISATIVSNETNFDNQTVISHDVVYEVVYNYTKFIAEAPDDTEVATSIGNVASVKSGLESTSSFAQLYSVSQNSTSFSIEGNQICPTASCGSSYVSCSETTLGLTPLCRSVCFSSFTCENSGSCVHRTSTLTPNCNCLASSTTWYLGARCEYKVEVWMVVVFILGFVLIIALIIFIGYLCFKRKQKISRHDYASQSVNKNQELPKKNTSTTLQRLDPNDRENDGYNVESDTLPLSPATPITSNALVTVQESSESSISEGRYEDPEAPAIVEEARQVEAANSANSEDDPSIASNESENGPDLVLSGITSRNSVAESDAQSRQYNSLQFPDTQHRNSEAERRYNTLTADRSWDKGTQTNTKISIELPDSILMNRI